MVNDYNYKIKRALYYNNNKATRLAYFLTIMYIMKKMKTMNAMRYSMCLPELVLSMVLRRRMVDPINPSVLLNELP